ncbi:uncharacterized protein LOC122063769 isoform X1 [Macadamia integrifolia]|uniref:uncharacterized protein LOC122063769 isoform X1 n=1 Tax=Macadamia integrifolia TaxID=60698 RepID=UPI001C4E8CC4|nr:uncharacterized protein LOC122063769 isoform X1 [Macadamia integrifolia]
MEAPKMDNLQEFYSYHGVFDPNSVTVRGANEGSSCHGSTLDKADKKRRRAIRREEYAARSRAKREKACTVVEGFQMNNLHQFYMYYGMYDLNIAAVAEKKRLQVIRNREYAAEARAKKQAYIAKLEAELAKLEKEYAILYNAWKEMVAVSEMMKFRNFVAMETSSAPPSKLNKSLNSFVLDL